MEPDRKGLFTPLPQDKYIPTNEHLWQSVLDLAQGKRKELRVGDKTYHAPNDGAGWRSWPSPNGVAWAVKQYNGLGGGWKLPKESSTIVLAGLGDTLDELMRNLLTDWDLAKAKTVGEWFQKNFRIQSPKTPRGMKDLKDQAERLRWWLVAGPSSYANKPEAVEQEVSRTWNEIRPRLGDLVRGFTDEGGVVVPEEVTVGGNTYLNEVGVKESVLKKFISRLEPIFKDLKGWHRKALTGGLTVVLASPREFRGTAAGVYKRSQGGKLFVRATPNILKRSGGTYGSFEYILVHELGHRFEDKNRIPEDFDKSHWWTTKYSRKEGESFAELFALSHFGLRGPWDQDRVERFQALMSGQGDISKPELPEHLRQYAR